MPTATLERTKPAVQVQYKSMCRPAFALYDGNDVLTVVLQMPSVDYKTIAVRISQGVLRVEAKCTFQPPTNALVKYDELQIGDYRIALDICDQVNVDKVEATYDSGLLTLTLPKTPQNKIVIKGR